MKKIPVLLFHISVAHAFLFLWRTSICGAPGVGAPQNYFAMWPTELFLWRTSVVRHRKSVSVAHAHGAPQKKKLVARILWRTQQFRGCATKSQFGAPLITLFLLVRPRSAPPRLNKNWMPSRLNATAGWPSSPGSTARWTVSSLYPFFSFPLLLRTLDICRYTT